MCTQTHPSTCKENSFVQMKLKEVITLILYKHIQLYPLSFFHSSVTCQ